MTVAEDMGSLVVAKLGKNQCLPFSDIIDANAGVGIQAILSCCSPAVHQKCLPFMQSFSNTCILTHSSSCSPSQPGIRTYFVLVSPVVLSWLEALGRPSAEFTRYRASDPGGKGA